MPQKYRLDKRVIPAGIFLLLAAAAMFLHHIIIPGLNDLVLYGIGGGLVIVAILLFTRHRNAACGVFFLILTLFAAVGVIAWAMAKSSPPFHYLYGVRTICFLGLTIVCLRRIREPKTGPWFIAVCIYVAALPAMMIYGLQEPAIPDKLVYYLTATDLLLFIGLLLTALAFRYAPKTAETSQPSRESQPQPASQYGSVPQSDSTFSGNSGPASRPEMFSQKENIYTAPDPEPAPQEPESGESQTIEIAQVEWLEDE